MDYTSCGDKCPFVKAGLCESDKGCPNYIESWWIEQGKETPKLVSDCSPKRMLINDQQMFNRMEGMQATIDKLEHRLTQVQNILELLILQSKEFIVEQRRLLPLKEDSQGEISYERANTQKH